MPKYPRALLRSLPILLGLLAPASAPAALGGKLASVQDDVAHVGGTLATHAMSGYARHDLGRRNSGAVHEFTNAQGKVFAVTWSGPGKPDLRQLLGSYFSEMQVAGASNGRRTHALRRPTVIDRSGVRIVQSGHMGWFRGVAYIPALAPAGFDPNSLEPNS
jgi:hypothetical protein